MDAKTVIHQQKRKFTLPGMGEMWIDRNMVHAIRKLPEVFEGAPVEMWIHANAWVQVLEPYDLVVDWWLDRRY